MGVILDKAKGDFDQIRTELGNISAGDLPDSAIEGFAFLGIAEAVITKLVTAQAANGVASVNTIVARADADPDKTFLRAATAAYVAWKLAPKLHQLAASTIKLGDRMRQYSDSPAQSQIMAEQIKANIAFYLSQITNWGEETTDYFVTDGPTTSGEDSGTVSGFFRVG